MNFDSRIMIIEALRKMENPVCLNAANNIKNVKPSGPINIELRNADLTIEQLKVLCEAFVSLPNAPPVHINTLSFSYNKIGDDGARLLSASMPLHLNQLGLVGCDITDLGAIELLGWLKKTTHLTLFCVENNKFSSEIKKQFKEVANQGKGFYLEV